MERLGVTMALSSKECRQSTQVRTKIGLSRMKVLHLIFSTRAERLKAQWLFIIYDQSYSLNKQLMNALRLRPGRH